MRQHTEARSGPRESRTPRASRQQQQPGPSSRRFFTILALWLLTCWGVIGVLVAPLVDGGWWSVAGAAVATTLPLLALVRERSRARYPRRFFRLVVMRPFWYTQLLLPLAAAAGLAGLIGGAFFDHAILAVCVQAPASRRRSSRRR